MHNIKADKLEEGKRYTLALTRKSFSVATACWHVFVFTELSEKVWQVNKSLEGKLNLSPLFFRNELMQHMYVACMNSCGIWPEHSLMIKEQKAVSEFFYFEYFSHGGLKRSTFCRLFDTGTSQIHKNQSAL